MLQPKKPVKKYVPTAKEKKNLKDAKEQKNMRPPFTSEERKKMPRVGSMGTAKNGKNIKKAKTGTSLGMKSVKAGFDNNPGVTRADIITAAKGKAQNGKKMTNSQIKTNVTLPKTKTKNINAFQGKKGMLAKSGTSMKKCKYGCK
jgi:hypothetical protein